MWSITEASILGSYEEKYNAKLKNGSSISLASYKFAA
jgi:hypothetical protein